MVYNSDSYSYNQESELHNNGEIKKSDIHPRNDMPSYDTNTQSHTPYPLTRNDSTLSDNSSNRGTPNSEFSNAELYMNPLLKAVNQELEQHENKQRTTTKKRNVTNLAPEEKRQRRLMRNRVAAKECRRKKKLYVEELERKARMLEIQNNQLTFELKELNAKLTLGLMRYQVTHGHSYDWEA